MERFRKFGGIVLSKDPADESMDFDTPLFLRGGRNMLKRSIKGLRRRPGFGALSVVSEAVIDTGTSPKGVFPASFSGIGDTLLAIDNGDLKKYDQSDSFDQVTRSLSNARPTFGALGGYALAATGGKVLKYDGSNVPSPLGSKMITSFEPASDWDGDHEEDTDNEIAGTACLKLTSTGAAVSSVLTNVPETVGCWNGFDPFSHVDSVGPNKEKATIIPSGVLNGRTLSGFYFLAYRHYLNDINYNFTIRVQYEGVDGKPDGVDLGTETVDKSVINDLNVSLGGGVSVPFTTPIAIENNGKGVAIIIDINASETVAFYPWKAQPASSEVQPKAEYQRAADESTWIEEDDADYPTYMMAFRVTSYVENASSLDLYTAYPDASTISFHLLESVADAVTEGANSYIRLETDSTNYFEHLITNDDCGVGSFSKKTLTRGGRNGAGSDFVVVGNPDWADINNIRVGFDPTDSGDYILFDYCYLLHQWAPPDSDKVFVADGRAFVCSGRIVYYSQKWNPNVFYIDSYLIFPSDVVAVIEAGSMVLFLTGKGAWKGIPLSEFPDYKIEPLSSYGCVGASAATEATIAGRKGAAWITRNRGIVFWSGDGLPEFISHPIREVFTDYEANSQNFDYTRQSEAILVYHPRHNELWVFYPTLFTDETNLKYAWVFQCETLEWMPLFEWGGDSNIIMASVYRDANDGLFKLLLTDSDGSVWHEGYVGTTILSDTTSKDGYVDSNTTGNLVKGYIEMPFVGGWAGDRKNKDQWWNQLNFKYLPNTTNAFVIDVSYKVAEKESEPDSSYPKEIEVVFGDDWTSLGDRSTTQANAKNVVERNVKFEDSVIGHAVALKIGQFSSGGSVEWELYGAYARGGARGGER